MDLLQEISNRLRSESNRVWGKVTDLAYEATIGIAKEYRKKGLELLKLTAATYYIQALSLVRKHFILVYMLAFSVVLLAVTAVVIPTAMVLASSWVTSTKLIVLSALGIVYATGVLFCLRYLFSEEKWMKASGFQELLDSIDNESR